MGGGWQKPQTLKGGVHVSSGLSQSIRATATAGPLSPPRSLLNNASHSGTNTSHSRQGRGPLDGGYLKRGVLDDGGTFSSPCVLRRSVTLAPPDLIRRAQHLLFFLALITHMPGLGSD